MNSDVRIAFDVREENQIEVLDESSSFDLGGHHLGTQTACANS